MFYSPEYTKAVLAEHERRLLQDRRVRQAKRARAETEAARARPRFRLRQALTGSPTKTV
jgi:hypothetical protein